MVSPECEAACQAVIEALREAKIAVAELDEARAVEQTASTRNNDAWNKLRAAEHVLQEVLRKDADQSG